MNSHYTLLALLLAVPSCAVDSVRAESEQAAVKGPVLQLDSLRLRRIWSGDSANFYASEPSPDGRFVSEIDWSTGDLAVRDLQSGALRRVTNKGPWTSSTDYAEFSVWSADGGRLAYSWFSEQDRGYQLRVIDADGGNMQVVVPSHPDMLYIAAEHWSPDQRNILVTIFRADRSSQIAIVSVDDGSVRVLKSSEWRHPFVAAFSPDGRYIAFDFHPDDTTTQRDIFAMPVDGSRETRIVGGAANDILLGWLPDGGSVLFYSDRGQTRGIWRQRVRDGRPIGEAALVRADVWQLFPLGFSADAYYYGVNTESPQVHTATVDLEGRRVLVAPAAVQEPSRGRSSFGAWSPDGQFLAYSTQPTGDRTATIVIRPVSGEEARSIRVRIDRPRFLQWTPDSRHLWFFGEDARGREGVFKMDIRSGEVSLEAIHDRSPASGLGHYRVAPDGRTLLYRRSDEPTATAAGIARSASLISHDLESGTERELYRVQGIGPVFFSPDGRSFVGREADVNGRRRLVVGRTDGSAPLRTIFETDRRVTQNRGGFPWTPDGRHVLVPVLVASGSETEILIVPVDGGDPATLLTWPGELLDLRLSSDGRRLSFTTGQTRGEIWRLEGLPTSDTPARTTAGAR